MTDALADYDAFAATALSWLQARNDTLWREFSLDTCERFDLDLHVGFITFSSAGAVRAQAQFVPVGSLSAVSQTWLWSWSNFNFPLAARGRVKPVRKYGRDNGISELTNAKWPATEEDAWRVTAVAAQLLNAEGAYLCPMSQVSCFGLLFGLARVA